MSATATESATTRPSNLRVRVRVAALKLLLCSVRSAGLRSVEAPGQQCYRKVVDVMSIST